MVNRRVESFFKHPYRFKKKKHHRKKKKINKHVITTGFEFGFTRDLAKNLSTPFQSLNTLSIIESLRPSILRVLFTVRLLFLRYSQFIMSISRARRKPRRKLRSLVYLMIANTYGLRRRYGRRFYRKLLKRRYIRSVVLKTWSTKVWAYTNVWRRPLQCHISYKAFFHIRIFFNISEFLLYDFYNFHRSVLSRNLGVERRKLKFFLKKP